MAGAIGGVGGAQPDQRCLAGGAQRKQRGKGRRAGAVEGIGSEKFMRLASHQSPADRGIESGMTARQPSFGRTAGGTTIGGQPGDLLSQSGERGGRLAHMFLICSISARAGWIVKPESNAACALPDMIRGSLWDQGVAAPALLSPPSARNKAIRVWTNNNWVPISLRRAV